MKPWWRKFPPFVTCSVKPTWQPRRIASVRTADGACITVGLTDESAPGSVIELFEEDTAPYGAAKK
jgi:hypothetical protein